MATPKPSSVLFTEAEVLRIFGEALANGRSIATTTQDIIKVCEPTKRVKNPQTHKYELDPSSSVIASQLGILKKMNLIEG